MPDDPHALIAICFFANVALAVVLWATICRVAGLERRELKRLQNEAASSERRPSETAKKGAAPDLEEAGQSPDKALRFGRP